MTEAHLGRKTPFYEMHLRHHARMIPFAGFTLPLQYTGIVDEHRRVRSTVGIFDLSHMGEVEIRGPGALTFVQRMTVNDASALEVGHIQYTAMCYSDGGMVDDFLIYRLENSYLLVVNAVNIKKDHRWLADNRQGRVVIEDHSDGYALLAIQGPRAADVLARLTDLNLAEIAYYRFARGPVGGFPMLVSRTGYTGEDGFELYLHPQHAQRLWELVLDAGQKFQIEPVGLGARDSLRLEMKYLLYGQDIDRTTNPLESGLGWITKLDKGDFIGRQALLAVKQRGLSRRLAGFEMCQRAIPRQHHHLCLGDRKLGHVTSGAFSPSLNRGIGLGYLPVEYAQAGIKLEVLIRDKPVPAQVVKTPFYKGGSIVRPQQRTIPE
jgi:aminomethyltransferase